MARLLADVIIVLAAVTAVTAVDAWAAACWSWRKLGRDGRLVVVMIVAFPVTVGLQDAEILPPGRGIVAFTSLAVIFASLAAMTVVRRYDQWAWRTQHRIRGGRVVASQVDANSARLDAVETESGCLRARVDEILAIMAGAVAGKEGVSPSAKTLPQLYVVRDELRDEAG